LQCFSAIIFFNTVFAAHGCGNPEKNILVAEICDAPAPDSFRITSIGGTFITLSWKPAWEGANHIIYVSKKTSSGGWAAQFILPNVSGNTITVDSLEGGKDYRFRIATKCPSGDPSELTAFVDDHTAIVELTLIGRNPKNPKPINCIGIPYQSYKWVGFMVSGEGESNFFEVQVNDDSNNPLAYIRRVVTANPIVAVDQTGNFPNNFQPIIPDVPAPFGMVRLSTNNNSQPEIIGRIDVSLHKTPPRLDICVESSTQFPWKNGYTFTSMTAKETIISPTGGAGQGFGKTPFTQQIEVQNPFKDELHVLFPQLFTEVGKVSIHLLNTNGRIVFEQKTELFSSELTFPFGGLSSGVYFLVIETDKEVQVLKVLKSE
jgi:Secretion system C-terminal sorting domain/Fibronectin type III domain